MAETEKHVPPRMETLVTVRCSREERDRWASAAEATGRTIAEVVRDCLEKLSKWVGEKPVRRVPPKLTKRKVKRS